MSAFLHDILNAHRASALAAAERQSRPMPEHAAGMTIHQIRNVLLAFGWECGAIDWQSADGRHSLTLTGADGGTYRLTIQPEAGQ